MSAYDGLPLFDRHHDGDTYEPEHDKVRLNRQQQLVYSVMRDGVWRTLSEIAEETGEPEASISARLRDFRKPKFGKFDVQRRRRGEAKAGVHEYRLIDKEMSWD